MQFEGITYQPTEAYSEEKLRKAAAVIEAGNDLIEPYIKRGDSLGAKCRRGLAVILNFDEIKADRTTPLDCVYFESVDLVEVDEETRVRFLRHGGLASKVSKAETHETD